MLEYYATGKTFSDDDFIMRLDGAVREIIANEKWVKENMAFLDVVEEYNRDMEISFAEGRAEGRSEERERILRQLKELGAEHELIQQLS